MTIKGHPVYPGRPCPHSTGRGCDDYANRPVDPCIDFNCGWIVENSPLPEWMKPSNAKVIVVFNKFQWLGRAVDLAVPIGKRIPPRALNWLKAFAEQHGVEVHMVQAPIRELVQQKLVTMLTEITKAQGLVLQLVEPDDHAGLPVTADHPPGVPGRRPLGQGLEPEGLRHQARPAAARAALTPARPSGRRRPARSWWS